MPEIPEWSRYDVSGVYPAHYWDWPVRSRLDYLRMLLSGREQWISVCARFLMEAYAPKSAVDWGAGAGQWLLALTLYGLGQDVLALDGSSHVRESPMGWLEGEPVAIVDFRDPIDLGRTFDLALCVEVAEHIEHDYADILVSNVARSSDGAIYFTAATLGQRGDYHVNEQPRRYWLERFGRRGWAFDWLSWPRYIEFLEQHHIRPSGKSLEHVIKADFFLTNAMLLRPAKGLPAAERPISFFAQPDWNQPAEAWLDLVSHFALCFAPEEQVELVLGCGGPFGGQPDAMSSRVVELVRDRLGCHTWPPVVLDDDPAVADRADVLVALPETPGLEALQERFTRGNRPVIPAPEVGGARYPGFLTWAYAKGLARRLGAG